MFSGLLCFSLLAIVCFILAVDALDCMFNEFKTDAVENNIRKYFYTSTIHPRYIGLVSLLTSLIFLTGSINVTFGSLCIAMILSIGYRHWFPDNKIIENNFVSVKSGVSFWFRFFVLIAVPIIGVFYGEL